MSDDDMPIVIRKLLSGDDEAVIELVKKNSSITNFKVTVQSYQGIKLSQQNLIGLAAILGCHEVLAAILPLIKNLDILSYLDTSSRTVLMNAIAGGSLKCFQLLLPFQDANSRYKSDTIIHLLVRCGRLDMLYYLVSQRCVVHLFDQRNSLGIAPCDVDHYTEADQQQVQKTKDFLNIVQKLYQLHLKGKICFKKVKPILESTEPEYIPHILACKLQTDACLFDLAVAGEHLRLATYLLEKGARPERSLKAAEQNVLTINQKHCLYHALARVGDVRGLLKVAEDESLYHKVVNPKGKKQSSIEKDNAIIERAGKIKNLPTNIRALPLGQLLSVLCITLENYAALNNRLNREQEKAKDPYGLDAVFANLTLSGGPQSQQRKEQVEISGFGCNGKKAPSPMVR